MSITSIRIHHDDRVYACRLPFDGADHVVIEGAPCPHCGLSPWTARGKGIAAHDYDTYYADAKTRCCGARVGQMRTKVSTLFGIEEDEAVLLRGRCRVY